MSFFIFFGRSLIGLCYMKRNKIKVLQQSKLRWPSPKTHAFNNITSLENNLTRCIGSSKAPKEPN